tara:strand:- start:758 stop:991 length:234 start_codon:yes stop_codon:yes gene_type:complete
MEKYKKETGHTYYQIGQELGITPGYACKLKTNVYPIKESIVKRMNKVRYLKFLMKKNPERAKTYRRELKEYISSYGN